ncbi:hypothetical protein [Flavobacterium sp. 245]|uniref:hypothetical protein n=1 Tax=Flavobacterium sp. 245 TaxID=2512115 RepID=UPI00105D8905|nr:hypothetical protein [Flavobacterium sp. 245]TDP01552.1 hypothetical protein EV145_104261 [Flavobacterium sp. 245]
MAEEEKHNQKSEPKTTTKSAIKEKTTKEVVKDQNWQLVYLLEQFKKESDRAAVILVASIIDETLQTLLKSYLVPVPSSEDSLFDNATSPLSTFSAKIDITYRIGLISGKFARDLHIVRKIRNSFAHDIYGCSFSNGSVKSRIKELENSFIISQNIDNIKREDIKDGERGMFLYLTSAMIWEFNSLIKDRKEIKESNLEWFYTEKKQ